MMGRRLPIGLAVFAYALALLQRPGAAAADTKIDLHVDPVGFLADVASVWSSSGGLGQVQAGQYAGYLFPMGPFHAAGSAIGLSPWLVQRLWLGTILALAAWGAVRLLDALLERERGAAHLTAGVLIVLNPYVVLFANRTSVTLLGYAALPWLLLCVYRGLREPRGWLWPAAIALVIASTGGGVNAAVTAWILLGPLLLLGYELLTGAVRWRPAAGFVARTALLSVLASLWWIVPVAEHARYGLNFLPFTESVGAIWATTGLTEVLRGMGYWIGYLGTGFGDPLHPYFDTSGTLLFDLPVVVASLLVPAVALGGYAFTRQLRYAPFLLALVLLGTLAVMAGFPEGTPLRRGLLFAYYQLEPIQFLRTTHKAVPLVVVATALLGGMAAGEAWRRMPGGRAARAGVPVLMVVLAAVSSWPLLTGRAIGERIAYDEVPAAWSQTARDLERELPAGARTLVLPGQLFPSYRWGDTQDPILPALTERPVSVRTTVPYSDLHAADLLYTTDALIQQRRVLPGQLRPLVELLGARAVVTGTDDDLSRSGAIEPALAAALLERGGLGEPTAERGAERRFHPPDGEAGVGVTLAQVRRYELPGARAMVRVEPRAPELVVDGSAAGLAGLAALGALPADKAISYAGDRSAAELSRSAAAGSDLVVTDTNRRSTFLSSRARRTAGATLAADEAIAPEGVVLNPFPERGTAGQTIATYDGDARSIRAPLSPNFPQFPGHRPYAAFDGSTATHWRADPNLEPDRHWIEIELDAPRTVDSIEVLPRTENGAAVEAVAVGGRSFPVRPGWNQLPVDLGRTSTVRVTIDGVSGPIERGAGSLAEVRIPGLDVQELKRVPTLLTGAVQGADLRRSALTYLFARETGDDPSRRAARGADDADTDAETDADAELELHRAFALPSLRRFRLDALVSVAPDAPDAALDRLAGHRGAIFYDSSGRIDGLPEHRSSKAFDGDRSSAWIAPRTGGAWIGWRTPDPRTLRGFRLDSAGPRVAAPTAVRVRWPGGATMPLPVSPTGAVRLRRPLRSRRFRVEIASVAAPRAGPGVAPQAVGIAELRVPGLGRVGRDADRRLDGRCSIAVDVGDHRVLLRPHGTASDLDTGRPLRARACGDGATPLGRGPLRLATASGIFRSDLLRLRSPAPAGRPPVRGGGVVLEPGTEGRGRYDDVRLATGGPSWLVLGESFNRGWRAWCDGRELGGPVVIDGYANGWRIDGGCARARFAFAANGPAQLSYWAAGVACLAMLILLAVGWRRRRAGSEPVTGGEALVLPTAVVVAADRPPRLSLGRALAVGVVAGVVCGFVFALRLGVLAGPLVALVLWRGIGAQRLTLAAAGLLAVVVPAIYVVFLPRDRGGFNSDYAQDLLGAHWVGVAAWLLLAIALLRTLGPLGASVDGGRPWRPARRPRAPRASRLPPPESG